MANPTPKPLTANARAKGLEASTRVRIDRSGPWLANFAHHVRALVREPLAGTNDGIAAQLHTRGFTAPAGGKIDGGAVRVAFARSGVDRGEIKKLRLQAERFADAYEVDRHLMVFQLWHEWQRHEAVNAYKLGLSPADRRTRPFVFVPVHPDKWIPPWSREFDYALSMLGPPPWAFLVQALFGMIDPTLEDAEEHAERMKGEAKRRADARADGVEYGGHYDDATDLATYLAAVQARSPRIEPDQ